LELHRKVLGESFARGSPLSSSRSLSITLFCSPIAHSALAFKKGLQLATKPVMAEITKQVWLCAIDDLKPALTRNDYNTGALASTLNTWSSTVRAFLAGPLDGNKHAN
jgi:hypothetical protein